MKLKLEKRVVEIVREIEGETIKFKVALLTQKESNKILEGCVKHEWDRGQRFDKIDYYKFSVDKIDKMIVDWEGLEDKDGRALECNKTNKEVVFCYYSDLINSVLDEADRIGKEYEAELVDLEKN